MVTNMALAKSLLLTNDRFSSQFIFPKLNVEKNILTEAVDKEERLFIMSVFLSQENKNVIQIYGWLKQNNRLITSERLIESHV